MRGGVTWPRGTGKQIATGGLKPPAILRAATGPRDPTFSSSFCEVRQCKRDAPEKKDGPQATNAATFFSPEETLSRPHPLERRNPSTCQFWGASGQGNGTSYKLKMTTCYQRMCSVVPSGGRW